MTFILAQGWGSFSLHNFWSFLCWLQCSMQRYLQYEFPFESTNFIFFFCFPGFQFLVQLPVISYRYQFFFFSNRNNLLSLRPSLRMLVILAKGYLNLLNFLILIQQQNSHIFWWLSVVFSTKANLLSLFYWMSLGFYLINFIPMDL